MTSFVIVVSAPEQRAQPYGHGIPWVVPQAAGIFLSGFQGQKNMVALATIFAQLVAKATKVLLNSPLRKISPEFVAQNSSNL